MEMKIIDMNIYDFCNFVKNFLRELKLLNCRVKTKQQENNNYSLTIELNNDDLEKAGMDIPNEEIGCTYYFDNNLLCYYSLNHLDTESKDFLIKLQDYYNQKIINIIFPLRKLTNKEKYYLGIEDNKIYVYDYLIKKGFL